MCMCMCSCVLLQYALFRAQFDASPNTAPVLSLSRLLVMFYREDKDHSRLVSTLVPGMYTIVFNEPGIWFVMCMYIALGDWLKSRPEECLQLSYMYMECLLTNIVMYSYVILLSCEPHIRYFCVRSGCSRDSSEWQRPAPAQPVLSSFAIS